MKVSEIITGKDYKFAYTEVVHRKDMINTIVTISGRKRKGKGRPVYHQGIRVGETGGYIVFKTTIGRNVSASELKEIK